MGAGQIGGIATLLDMDFNNAAGFLGVKTDKTEAQYLVYYMPSSMMFCVGVLIEAHVVLTVASCVHGEKFKFDITAGTHQFLEFSGVSRLAQHICEHRGYNHSLRWTRCAMDNIALLVLDKQFSFHERERGTDFILNRIRYGVTAPIDEDSRVSDPTCRYYGWGSRRNGYLIPLLIDLRRVNVIILPKDKCQRMWNYEQNYLCIQQPSCRSEKFGALCPDDVGTVIECSGYVQGMMTSRLVDRPCGVGFTDMSLYSKFLTCGVDDSRDVIDQKDFMAFEYTPTKPPLSVLTTPSTSSKSTIKIT